MSTPTPGNSTSAADSQIKVWDLCIRAFHWSLASAFLVAFLTEDDWQALHEVAGYTVLGLITLRFVWGWIGPRHARWSDFVRSPAEILAYLKDCLHLRARRYIGHNPAGGAMVVALLISLVGTAVTGVALEGAVQLSGPLAPLFSALPDAVGHLVEEIHETLAHLTLLLVGLHLGGVLLASFQHRENLIKAMWNGRKKEHLS